MFGNGTIVNDKSKSPRAMVEYLVLPRLWDSLPSSRYSSTRAANCNKARLFLLKTFLLVGMGRTLVFGIDKKLVRIWRSGELVLGG